MDMIFDVPDELKHSSGIYKITNNKNGKIYVGRTRDFRKRFLTHRKSFYYLNGKISRFVAKNPDVKFTFSVLEVTGRLRKAEEYWIKKLKAVENGFNKFHSDYEYMRYGDGCIYLGKQKLKSLKEKRKKKFEELKLQQTKPEPEPVIEPIQKEKVKEVKGYGKFKMSDKPIIIRSNNLTVVRAKYLIINGIKHDYLGNRIKD